MNRADDECYTGTGPAAEVVGQVLERDALAEQLACVRQALPLPLRDCAVPSVGVATLEAERAELIAQRDELQRKLAFAVLTLEEIGAYRGDGSTYTTPWQDIVRDLGERARAALSHIKGA